MRYEFIQIFTRISPFLPLTPPFGQVEVTYPGVARNNYFSLYSLPSSSRNTDEEWVSAERMKGGRLAECRDIKDKARYRWRRPKEVPRREQRTKVGAISQLGRDKERAKRAEGGETERERRRRRRSRRRSGERRSRRSSRYSRTN